MQCGLFYTDELPAWPVGLKREFYPIAKMRYGLCRYSASDLVALERAEKLRQKENRLRNSFLTGTVTENIFRNHADFTAVTAASETSMFAGTNQQPWLPAGFFDQVPFRSVSLICRGVTSSTSGTNTNQFNVRLGTTSGSAFITGAIVGQTPTITYTASQTNAFWELRLDLTCTVSGIGSGNSTLSGSGFMFCPAFVSPFYYGLAPSSGSPATWTQTFDDSVAQYFNLTSTFSATSNSITCKYCRLDGLN